MVRKTHPTSATVAEIWTVIIITIMVAAEIAATISKIYIRALLLVELVQVIVSNNNSICGNSSHDSKRAIVVVIEEVKPTINYPCSMQICGKE
uniref:Uncharacterized protein n=1 Tax=Glossina palpalis gambiensis TaxID=67801 RepID=A0A1B0BWE7_9MUSC